MKGQSQVENNLDTNSGIGYRSAGKSKRRFRFKTWKQARDYMLPAGNFRVLIEMYPCIYPRSHDSDGAAASRSTCSVPGRADPDKHAPDREAPVVAVVLGSDGDPAFDVGDRFL